MNLIFFFFLHNNNIIGHHHYSLIEKKKVPKRVGNDPSLFLLTVFGLQFKPSFIRGDFVNGEQIKYINQCNVQLSWNLKMKLRNMIRKLVCSSNTDPQSQHLVKTCLQNSLFCGKMAFLTHCKLLFTLIWTLIQKWEKGTNLRYLQSQCACRAVCAPKIAYRLILHSLDRTWLYPCIHMSHSQMLGKFEYGLPAKFWRLVGCTEMLSW